MKKVSKKTLMASKGGNSGVDSHSSSSNSSCGTVAIPSTSGSSAQLSGGSTAKCSEFGNRRPKYGNRNNGGMAGTKFNYKQHMCRTGGNISSGQKKGANGNQDQEILIDRETELNNEIEGMRISRKTNLSHLLNFKFANSANQDYGDDYGGGYLTQFIARGPYKKSYDKYQFIQANCKFQVDESCEEIYSPDSFIDWEKVVEVQLLTPDFAYCAICLEQPTAPKITKCGHVYCYACVLQLLCLSEKKWAKCPICFDAVSEKDVRCVRSLNMKLFKIGDTISLRLMTRLRNSIKVTPKVSDVIKQQDGNADCQKPESEGDVGSKADASANVSPSAPSTGVVSTGAHVNLDKVTKLNLAQQVAFVYKPVLDCLKVRALDDTNEEVEKKFIDLAITKTEQTIVDIETKIKEQDHQDSQAEKDEEVPLNPLPQSKVTTKWVKELGAVGDSGNSGGVGGGGGGTEKYLFYQSEDGQMIFANAFTIKCMLKEYGSLDNCPPSVSGQIVDLCEVRVDESFRSSHRFLAHLPLATVVTFAELDLRPPVVSRLTLKHFAEEIRLRKEEKDRKRKEERKRERKINREMERKMYPGYSQTSYEPEDEDEFNMLEQLKAIEENFPSVSGSSRGGVVAEGSNQSVNNGRGSPKAAEERNKENKPRTSVSDVWDGCEAIGSSDLNSSSIGTTFPGAQFTSFADMLLCASPPSQSAWPVAKRCSGAGLTPRAVSEVQSRQGSCKMTYAQRMEAMEKEEEKHGESQQLLFAFDHVDSSSLSVADHVVGGVEHLLAPPSHNDAFSMAFQQALFKQAGKEKGKKKKKGNNSFSHLNQS